MSNYYELTVSSSNRGDLEKLQQEVRKSVEVEAIIERCEHGTNLSEGFGCDDSGYLKKNTTVWVSNCKESSNE